MWREGGNAYFLSCFTKPRPSGRGLVNRFLLFFLVLTAMPQNHLFQFCGIAYCRGLYGVRGYSPPFGVFGIGKGIQSSTSLRPCLYLRTLWAPFPLIVPRVTTSLLRAEPSLPHSTHWGRAA